MNTKDERFEILLSELGDNTPRHVGGVGGGYISEGEWAANQISHYGVDAILPLAARVTLTNTIETANLIVLRHFGFRDPQKANAWVQNARYHIRIAFSKIPEAVEYLKARLSDHNPTIRTMSANALGFLKASSSVELLITAMSDTNEEVQKGALKALKEIRGKSFLFGNSNQEKWRKWWIRKYNI